MPKPASRSCKKTVDSLIIIPNDKLMQVLGEDVSVLDAYAAANDVLHSAVAGIAEVINNPGLVNVDFADVRTVMSEVGMAMMGSATVGGPDRARLAAERAVASPLLEEINLAGARGVLVNITASAGLKMKEYHEVMNTIKSFTADDAMVIVGTVIDEAMKDELRVTMIATGLGGATARSRQPRLEVVEQVVERTGTDGLGMSRRDHRLRFAGQDAGGHPARAHAVAGARWIGVRCLGHSGVSAEAGGLDARQGSPTMSREGDGGYRDRLLPGGAGTRTPAVGLCYNCSLTP